MYIIFRQQVCKNISKIDIKKSENAFNKTATSQIVEYFYAKNVIVTTLDISAGHRLFKTVSVATIYVLTSNCRSGKKYFFHLIS